MGVDGAGHICVYISDFPVWSFEESSSSSTLPNSDIPFIRLFIHSFIHICSTTFSLSSHSTSQFRETCLSQIPTCSHPFLPSSLWPHLRQPTPPQTLRHPPQSPMPPASRPKSPLSLSRSPSPSKPWLIMPFKRIGLCKFSLLRIQQRPSSISATARLRSRRSRSKVESCPHKGSTGRALVGISDLSFPHLRWCCSRSYSEVGTRIFRIGGLHTLATQQGISIWNWGMVEASHPIFPLGKVHLVYWIWWANLYLSIVVELAVDLVVEKVAEGQKIKGKPLGFEGKNRIHGRQPISMMTL